jgi:hypothetical protein
MFFLCLFQLLTLSQPVRTFNWPARYCLIVEVEEVESLKWSREKSFSAKLAFNKSARK